MSKNAVNDVKKLVIKAKENTMCFLAFLNKNPEIIEVLVVGLSGLEPAHLIRKSLFKVWVEHLLPFDFYL